MVDSSSDYLQLRIAQVLVTILAIILKNRITILIFR